MIEVDNCYPSKWSTWNSSSLHPYLELYGEVHPFICTNLTETLTVNSVTNDSHMSAMAPVYEYFWTLGISEHLYEKFTQHTENVVKENVERLIHHDNEKLIRHDDIGAEDSLFSINRWMDDRIKWWHQ